MNATDLTPKQVDCLRASAFAPGISPWSFGSTTISVLKKAALIAVVPGYRYMITPAGEAILAQLEGSR